MCVGDEEQDFIHILEALLCIQNYRFIFMQRILDYMDVEGDDDKW